MPELSVVIVATDNEQRALLQVLVDGTSVARTVHTCASFPVAAADPITRRVRTANPDVTLVDIPADNPTIALRAIELLHQEMPDAAIFAVGTLNQPQVIVNAMRAGAREFIERPTNTTDLLEAFVRLTTAQRRSRQEGVRGKVYSIINAKGGNGATTVAVNLAIALKNMGATVGLLDADIYGPNVPVMLGTLEQPRALDERTIIPVQAHGVKMISMGLLNPGDKPLVWRGPMLHSVMQQFLRSVRWGQLDYLIVDLPPGTGDVQLSLMQSVSVSGAVVVTTPSVVALADVRKAIEMFRQVNVEILGIVENMSYFACPHCQGRIDVFGHGEGEKMAQTFGIPFLGEIEIDPKIRIGGDTGKPVASLGQEAPGAKSIYAMTRNVAARLSVVNLTASAPVVQIL